MRVLVTGGAGYVGSVLAPHLLGRGHQVRIVDCGFFGLDHVDPGVELIPGNILEFDKSWLDGIEAVIHLAGLSNDPMAAFSPSLNYMLNAGGSAIVAQAAKEAGISRFIFSSTCSVYGFDESGALTEEHHASPPFPYGISKVMAEHLLRCLTDEHFRPIILRKGTVVGWSPRMRYDLVTNAMVKSGLVDGEIVVHNPALWRPLIDVEDVAEAYASCLDADLDVTGVFNISRRNYTLGELGLTVAEGLESFGIKTTIRTEYRQDVRSYRVETAKAATVLKFTANKPMADTVKEVISKAMARPIADLEHPRYYNIQQMDRLMEQGLLTSNGHGRGEVADPREAVGASS